MTPRTKVRVALLLWIVFGVVVWNVVFDRILVLAGRRYSHDAALAARAGQYLRIEEVMRPAIADGVRVASAAGGAIAIFGAAAVWFASRRYGPSASPKNDSARASLMEKC